MSKNSVKLDLKQHRSKDALLGRLAGIDGIADMWVCIHSNTGKDFLPLYFFCSHEGATSCEAAMDAPGNEWNGVYDEHGRPLLKSPPWIGKVEETRLRKLGLWSQLVAQIDPARVKFVYPFTDIVTNAR